MIPTGIYDNQRTFERQYWEGGKVYWSLSADHIEQKRTILGNHWDQMPHFGSYPDLPEIKD